jgi:hypothetical protein
MRKILHAIGAHAISARAIPNHLILSLSKDALRSCKPKPVPLASYTIALTLFSSPLSAQTVSPHPDSVTVTLYHEGAVDTATFSKPQYRYEAVHDGLAFITETRGIDLPAGPATIEFRDVASTMVPQTADIQGLPANTLERNFDYDLLSPGSLLAKSIGETVHIVRTDSKTGKQSEQTAIVRSAAAAFPKNSSSRNCPRASATRPRSPPASSRRRRGITR